MRDLLGLLPILLVGCATAPSSAELDASSFESGPALQPPPAPRVQPLETGADPLGPQPERAVEAEEEHAGEHGHNHVAVFLGLGVETKDMQEAEEGFAVGLEYERRFHPNWGVGGLLEGLRNDTLREALFAVPVSFHPDEHWRLFGGPAVEFASDENSWALRVGFGYEFPINPVWSIYPEFSLDLMETGENTWVVGLAVGRAF